MIPIIGQIFSALEKAADKIWPDADEKIKNASALKLAVMEHALTENKLLFGDTKSAREAYSREFEAKNVPKWARSIQVCGRQFALYGTVFLYIYSKISVTFGLPEIMLNERDYWLIGTVFVFLFGARSVEKLLKKA